MYDPKSDVMFIGLFVFRENSIVIGNQSELIDFGAKIFI